MVTTLLPLVLTDVTVRRRSVQFIGPVSLTLGPTGVTVLAGSNGAGKTTLLRVMHGLQRISSGTLTWADPSPDIAQRQAFVFQQPILLRRSVLANVAFPAQIRGASRRAAHDLAAKCLENVGLAGFAARSADDLSGGETQKMALARALVTDPDILFLDEPTASLDAASTRDIEAIIREASERGTRIVLATHDLGQLRRLADDVAFLHGGRVLEHRATGDFLEAPANRESAAYIRGDLVL